MRTPKTLPIGAIEAPDGLSPANRIVFDYWRSLRHGAALPSRSDFHPGRIRSALPRLSISEARQGLGVKYRLVGTAIAEGLGFDLTGRESNSVTPPAFQATRVARYDRMLAGYGMLSHRRAATTARRVIDWQELFLPFGDVREDGSRHILMIADFNFSSFGEHAADPAEVLGPPRDTAFIAL